MYIILDEEGLVLLYVRSINALGSRIEMVRTVRYWLGQQVEPRAHLVN